MTELANWIEEHHLKQTDAAEILKRVGRAVAHCRDIERGLQISSLTSSSTIAGRAALYARHTLTHHS
jgi:hypothetical protein